MNNPIVQIRSAEMQDAEMIAILLGQMGYPQQFSQLQKRLQQLIAHPQEMLLVGVHDNRVCGFLSLHYIPQLALVGDFARISYFCIDEALRHQNIGQQMLHYAEQRAIQHGCDRLELHSSAHRTGAHRFYQKHGYAESPKYFIKMLPQP